MKLKMHAHQFLWVLDYIYRSLIEIIYITFCMYLDLKTYFISNALHEIEPDMLLKCDVLSLHVHVPSEYPKLSKESICIDFPFSHIYVIN